MGQKNKQETMIDAEVTITFVVNDVCWASDLDDDESYFSEIVEENLSNEFDWNNIEYSIKSVKKIS